jgi:hypothetical protein
MQVLSVTGFAREVRWTACLALVGCASVQDRLAEADPDRGPSVPPRSAPASGTETAGPKADFDSKATRHVQSSSVSTQEDEDEIDWPPKWPWLLLGGYGLSYAKSDAAIDSVDELGASYQVGAGYLIHRYVSIETGYFDLGRVTTDLGAGPGDDRIQNQGVQLSAVGHWPIITIDGVGLEAIGRIGACHWWETEKDHTGAGTTTRHDEDTDLYWGLGLQLYLTGPWFARLEWTRLDKSGRGTDLDSGMISLIWAL